jgi:hypothetical protein
VRGVLFSSLWRDKLWRGSGLSHDNSIEQTHILSRSHRTHRMTSPLGKVTLAGLAPPLLLASAAPWSVPLSEPPRADHPAHAARRPTINVVAGEN